MAATLGCSLWLLVIEPMGEGCTCGRLMTGKKVPAGPSYFVFGRRCPEPAAASQMSITATVKRACLFCAHVLSHNDCTESLEAFGIKDRRYVPRLIHKLSTQFSLDISPGRGRPAAYSTEQLAAGQAALASPSSPYHSSRALVEDLKEEGELPEGAPRRGYMPALTRHLASQGLSLGYGTRTKQHALTKADEKERLRWCREHQQDFREPNLKDWWFEDEKQHQEGGKARCEWVQGRQGGGGTALTQGWARCAVACRHRAQGMCLHNVPVLHP